MFKTSLSQINPNKTSQIGKFRTTGDVLIKTLKKTIDSYIDSRRESANEIITYSPKIEGVVARVKSLDEILNEIIKFVAQNNLPILMI